MRRGSGSEAKYHSISWVPLSLAVVMLLFVFNFYIIWYATEHNLQTPFNNYVVKKSVTQSNQPQQSNQPPDNFIQRILHEANLTLPAETTQQLPTLSSISSQYGPSPIIRNLESCSTFRSSIPIQHRMLGVAGLFNTGTNYLASLLENNCQLPHRSSHERFYPFREQVPWGKHNTPSHRGVHTAMGNGNKMWTLNYTWVMPVVIIKDPFHWMVSNCRHEYFLWEHDELHCPNVTAVNERGEVVPNSFEVGFAKETRHYTSLVHFWNEWYREYLAQSKNYPLVYIRFEDLVFHTEHVIRSLCDCIGGNPHEDHPDFMYLEESAKNYAKVHAGASGYVDAMLRYGNPKKRLEGWTREDYSYALEKLNGELMETFGYRFPDWN